MPYGTCDYAPYTNSNSCSRDVLTVTRRLRARENNRVRRNCDYIIILSCLVKRTDAKKILGKTAKEKEKTTCARNIVIVRRMKYTTRAQKKPRVVIILSHRQCYRARKRVVACATILRVNINHFPVLFGFALRH